jgi:NTP pyrophosphatase (non-canonical NTP hydrolase)
MMMVELTMNDIEVLRLLASAPGDYSELDTDRLGELGYVTVDGDGVAAITEAGRAALGAFDKALLTVRIVESELTVGEVKMLQFLDCQGEQPIDYSEFSVVRLLQLGYIREDADDDGEEFIEITDAGKAALVKHESQRADDQQKDFLRRVNKEVARQRDKWGVQRHEPLRWLGILMEEVGEVAKAIIEGKPDEMEKELVQVCAVIVSWAKYSK